MLSAFQLPAQTNPAAENELKAKEQAAWQAWKEMDQKVFDSILTDDAINIAGGSIERGKQQIMKDLTTSGCTVSSFSLSNFNYLWVDKDAVILTYNASQDVTCGGKKQPAKVIASSVWQKKGGKWISPFHQETPVEGM